MHKQKSVLTGSLCIMIYAHRRHYISEARVGVRFETGNCDMLSTKAIASTRDTDAEKRRVKILKNV